MDIRTFKRIAANSIINRLETIGGKLPKTGFVCGGAVANSLLSIIDGIEYPINDIDIFITDSIDNYTKLNSIILGDESDDYSYTSIQQLNYDVFKSYRCELFNYIFIRMNTIDPEELSIIESFDINCCQIGIDLISKRLVTTPEFDDFIENRILKCVTFNTPAHTVLRLVQKSKDLQLYIDMNYIYNSMKAHFQSLPEFKNLFKSFSEPKHLFFGKKYYSIYNDNECMIAPFFELKSFKDFQIERYVKRNLSMITEINIMNWKKTKTWTLIPRIF